MGPVLAAAGKLKIGLLEVDDNVVAAQIWLESEGTMFIYYSGYDPAWSRFSVQLVATIECLKDGISRGLTSVEFLRGGGHAKERWETSKRLRVNATLARRPAVARFSSGCHVSSAVSAFAGRARIQSARMERISASAS